MQIQWWEGAAADCGEAVLKSEHAMNPEAQDAYLKGHHLLEKGTIEDLPKGISYLGQAIEKEPFAIVRAHYNDLSYCV